MTSQNLYVDPAPLDRNVHKNLRLKPLENFSYAKHLHSSVIAGSEFFAASHHFPVVFVKNSSEKMTPIVVLSLQASGHNLGDEWKGVYVPAYVRRYPFVMDSKDNTLFIDRNCGALQEGEGEPLLTEEGKPTEVLNQVLVFNKQIDTMYKATDEYIEALEKKDLLEPYKGELKLKDQSVKLDRYFVINEKKWHESLSDEEVADWFKKGWIAWTYAHLSSLLSMSKVIERLPKSNEDAPA